MERSMKGTETEKKFQELDVIIEKYQKDQGMVIKVLQEAQNIFGYLPENVQTYIAMKMDMPISSINGVVSFYSLFSQEPRGIHIIGVCLGTACYVKGAQDIINAIKEELAIEVNETSLDGLFTLTTTRCLGACGLAPVIKIDEDVYGRVNPADIPSILYQYSKKAKATSE